MVAQDFSHANSPLPSISLVANFCFDDLSLKPKYTAVPSLGKAMRRRDFVAGIAGLACAWPRTAAESRDFRVADTQSNDHPTARALVHMSELVSDRTQGRHRMLVYADGLLGEQEASFEQTRTGAIDINRTNMAPLASFVGKANIFGLPFLFRSADHLHRILDSAIGDDILQSLEPHGFVGLAFFEAGARVGLHGQTARAND